MGAQLGYIQTHSQTFIGPGQAWEQLPDDQATGHVSDLVNFKHPNFKSFGNYT
jgi:hypothetical protein